MRREPFGEISRRKLVGREIKLKHTVRSDARSEAWRSGWNGGWSGVRSGACTGTMPRCRNPAAPMSASRPGRNLVHPNRVRIARHGRGANLNRRVDAVYVGGHVSQLSGPDGGGSRKSPPGPG